MQELIRNAWFGWQNYIGAGKYVALLAAVLLLFGFGYLKSRQRTLLVYTTVAVIGCAFPFTAAVLMLYQTRFYDYQWIWNCVPIVLVTGYGLTLFFEKVWSKPMETSECRKFSKIRTAAATVAVVLVVLLCGRLGQSVFDGETEQSEREAAIGVLAEMVSSAEGDIVLWAPKSVMANARAHYGEIRLLYGRNIWDASLGAYTYDTYDKECEMLYLWMSNAEETGSITDEQGEKVVQGADCVREALEAGVTDILLPGNIAEEDVALLEQAAGVQAGELADYYWLKLPESAGQ